MHTVPPADIGAPAALLSLLVLVLTRLACIQESEDECCAACIANDKCNVWVFCGDPAGCSGHKQGECWLKRSEALNMEMPQGARSPGGPSLQAGAPLPTKAGQARHAQRGSWVRMPATVLALQLFHRAGWQTLPRTREQGVSRQGLSPLLSLIHI